MTEQVVAKEKHACPACGAQAEWNPTRQMLICPFCGTESPYAGHKQGGIVDEQDLLAALRALSSEATGWNTDRRSVQCQSCRAVMVFEPAKVGKNCDFCGSPALVDYDDVQAPIRPQCLLPFRISQADVRDRMRRWYARKWLAPNALRKKALVDQVHGVYIPYWTFDAKVHCTWTAEAGHHYYTTSSYRDAQGRTRTRQERHTRWEPAAGELDHAFDDELVPGTTGVEPRLLRSVEPFPTPQAVPYDTAYLSGFVVERYQIDLEQAAGEAARQMHDALMRLCGAQVPGDTYRNLQIQPSYSDQTFKHTLVPVWLLTYTYGPRRFQVVANGHTGDISGDYPKSPWKIALLVFVAIVIVIIMAIANGG